MIFRKTSLLLSMLVLLLPAGCRAKGGSQAALPPATGAGAPPMPQLPALDPPAASTGTTAVATTSDARTTGTLYPHAEAQLAPNASGVISEVLVKEGDRVKRGDVVFRLDARDAELRRQQAAAALDAARVNLKAAKVDLDRSRAMLEQNAINRAQWDQIETRYDAAVVGVRQAEVALAMAQKGVADASVRAPFDGIVTAKLKNAGEMATMMPPSVVVVMQDQSVLELRFRLPERLLMKVKPGMTLTARFEALGGLTRNATVTRVNPTVDARTRTVETIAELQNPGVELRPGLLAEVQLGEAAAATPPSDGGPR